MQAGFADGPTGLRQTGGNSTGRAETRRVRAERRRQTRNFMAAGEVLLDWSGPWTGAEDIPDGRYREWRGGYLRYLG